MQADEKMYFMIESRFCCATCFVEHDSLEMRLASLLVYCKALKTGIQECNGVGTVVVLIVLKNEFILAVL